MSDQYRPMMDFGIQGPTKSEKVSQTKEKILLKEGDVIELEGGHTVYADIPEHFAYSNRRGSWRLTNTKVYLDGQFDYLYGQYIVYKITTDEGGKGHGPHDAYPYGHHVYCEKIYNPTTKVDFYQTGSFTAMITDIKPIGRGEKLWVFKKPEEEDRK